MIGKFAIDWTARKVLAKSYMLEENGEPVFISRALSREETQIDKLLSKASKSTKEKRTKLNGKSEILNYTSTNYLFRLILVYLSGKQFPILKVAFSV